MTQIYDRVPKLHGRVHSQKLKSHSKVGKPLKSHEPGNEIVKSRVLEPFSNDFFIHILDSKNQRYRSQWQVVAHIDPVPGGRRHHDCYSSQTSWNSWKSSIDIGYQPPLDSHVPGFQRIPHCRHGFGCPFVNIMNGFKIDFIFDDITFCFVKIKKMLFKNLWNSTHICSSWSSFDGPWPGLGSDLVG